MLWRILWKAEALFLAVLVGCSTAQPVIRVDAGAEGETLLYIPRAATVEPVEVSPEEVTAAIRRLAREVRLTGSPRETVERLFQLDALYGDYLYLHLASEARVLRIQHQLEGHRRGVCVESGHGAVDGAKDTAAGPSHHAPASNLCARSQQGGIERVG
jgi:hypothetical protein